MRIDDLAWIATGRRHSLFESDVERCGAELRSRLGGARLLVIGGVGSIGRATVRAVLGYAPRALHVVDLNENNLAELVRDLRGSRALVDGTEFLALSLDYGSHVMHRLLLEQAPYDYVFNFAAVKHVRSERDICSLLHMIHTNIVKQADFLGWLRSLGRPVRYFSVSTDKAANPVNLMGATKRFGEYVMFDDPGALEVPVGVTSARFANVAFSDGSLLYGWTERLAKGQPIAVPGDTRRYFVSGHEAGHICLLAGVVGSPGHVLIPRPNAGLDLCELSEIACRFLEAHNYRSIPFSDEKEATAQVQSLRDSGCYPLLVTPLDTSGEKPYEEFIGTGEEAIEIGLDHLQAVRPPPLDRSAAGAAIETFRRAIADPGFRMTKHDVVAVLSAAIPHFRHSETGKSLDGRL
jgi:FlaA1/EpsC-like NDP-sugar epimerase